MIRAALALVVLALVAVAVSAVIGQPGRASLEWLGWRLDMTAAAADPSTRARAMYRWNGFSADWDAAAKPGLAKWPFASASSLNWRRAASTCSSTAPRSASLEPKW